MDSEDATAILAVETVMRCWREALLSGRYKQGSPEFLKRGDEWNAFGVLCDVVGCSGFLGMKTMLPVQIAGLLGIRQTGRLVDRRYMYLESDFTVVADMIPLAHRGEPKLMIERDGVWYKLQGGRLAVSDDGVNWVRMRPELGDLT